MGEPIKANFSPSCVDCISWSQDGELAIAGPDIIQLYIPKSIALDAESEPKNVTAKHWDTNRIRTNDFTQKDLPEKFTVSFENSSIGEEQSAHFNAAIAWSPPGLSRHGRCALGLLSTGHVLSIWAAQGNILGEDGWERVLVINNVLAANNIDDHQIQGVNAKDTEEIRQLRNRVRSFTWAQALRTHSNESQGPIKDTSWPSKSQETIILIVANEYNEVIVLQITSSFNKKDPKRGSWTATVKLWETVAKPPTFTRLPGPKSTLNRPWKFIRNLTISPWAGQGREKQALLAYISNGNVKIRQLDIAFGQKGEHFSDIQVILSHQELTPYIGELASQDWFDALTWDSVIRNNKRGLVYSNPDVVCVTRIPISLQVFSSSGEDELIDLQSIKGITSQVLPQSREEHISSIVFDREPAHKKARLHFGTVQYETKSVLEVSDQRDVEVIEASKWQTLIEDQREEFDEEHSLAGNVLVKLYGLAASPIGGLIVACFSLHPSDRLDYLMAHKESCTIVFDDERLDLSAWFLDRGNGPTIPDEMELSTELFTQTVRQIQTSSVVENGSVANTSSNIEKLYSLRAQLCLLAMPKNVTTAKIYPSQATWAMQLLHVLDLLHVKDPGAAQTEWGIDSHNTPTHLILSQYLSFVLCYSLDSVGSSESSQQILYMAARIGAFGVPGFVPNKSQVLLAARAFKWLSENIGMNTKYEIQSCRRILQTEEHREAMDVDEAATDLVEPCYEKCKICSASIQMESLDEARCLNGHCFVRCSLTYLAIQAPGISKYCRVCGREYLNDTLTANNAVESMRSGAQSQDAYEPSLDGTSGFEGEIILMSFDQPATSRPLAQQDGWHILKKNDVVDIQNRKYPSLAEALYMIYSTCIYCGGKYVS